MRALRDIQSDFRRALLTGDDASVAALIRADGIEPSAHLAIYRNNVESSLVSVLKEAFPVVCRLVDERFFDYAAHEFLSRHPPKHPCLAAYGAEFPDFFAQFPPCRDLAYLSDVARLEWLIRCAAQADIMTSVTPEALRTIAFEDTPRLIIRLHPALQLLASPWPIDRIWRANRPSRSDREAADERIDLASGGTRIEISRRDNDVTLRTLPAASFAFRRALREGRPLERAVEAALAEDECFDLITAFADLFRDGIVVAFALDRLQQEDSLS